MRKTRTTCTCQQPGSVKDRCCFWRRCSIYRWRSLWTPCKSQRIFPTRICAEGIAFAHEHGVKVYVTVNILAHNQDLPGVREYLTELKELKPDALIIADPGIFTYAREICPEIECHISTQANNTNYETYPFLAPSGSQTCGNSQRTFTG